MAQKCMWGTCPQRKRRTNGDSPRDYRGGFASINRDHAPSENRSIRQIFKSATGKQVEKGVYYVYLPNFS